MHFIDTRPDRKHSTHSSEISGGNEWWCLRRNLTQRGGMRMGGKVRNGPRTSANAVKGAHG